MAFSFLNRIVELERKFAEADRRARNRKRTGTISEVGSGENAGKYRVKISETDGNPYLTPWMKTRTVGAGVVKIDVVRKVGEQVDVISESGDLTDAVIDMSTYSDANARENGGNTPLHIKVDGDGAIICGTLSITADVTITGALSIVGASVTHNGVNIGDSHVHGGITVGAADTEPPH